MIKSQILATNANKILSILNNIIKNDNDSTPLISYPVLIGSHAAKWHFPSFRDTNDWDLVATPLQSASFVNKVMTNATFKNINLIYYPGGGLKIIGECIEPSTDEKSTNFDIELVSDKVDLRKMKSLNKKESDDNDVDNIYDVDNGIDIDDDNSNDISKIEFERFNVDQQPKLSALMILELCYNVEDKILFPLLSNFPCIHSQRDEQVELMLNTRIKETEIIQGVPGAHINLNMTNEDFLDHDDNLLSKAWKKKSLFEIVDYQTKLNCVREEAMDIMLERYLVPMISKNQETSYNLALVRICTTLTKGWFRQFAIDNYPQLSNLDKDLLSIAHDVIDKHPLKKKNPQKLVLDPETQAIFETVHPYTKEIFFNSSSNISGNDKHHETNRTGIKITSPVNIDISITAIVQLSVDENENENSNNDDAKSKVGFTKLTSKHVFVLGLNASISGS
ncbi:hypothetical protein C1645_815101 [Glomus cerebriforme]|uniref:Uncharacterized protein n=1 Tax=Glomus cerebriforme TaxID=658196 RepID=A0A397TJP3_9GLOM|nr:hypothetical protein C1645_815101 [Glomus cerebriforme]